MNQQIEPGFVCTECRCNQRKEERERESLSLFFLLPARPRGRDAARLILSTSVGCTLGYLLPATQSCTDGDRGQRFSGLVCHVPRDFHRWLFKTHLSSSSSFSSFVTPSHASLTRSFVRKENERKREREGTGSKMFDPI